MAESGEPALPPSNEYLGKSVYVPAEPKWEYKMSNLVWYQARGKLLHYELSEAKTQGIGLIVHSLQVNTEKEWLSLLAAQARIATL